MKLPIPLLLYTVSLGLFGWSGWKVYQAVPLWKNEAREAATRRGQQDAKDRIGGGRGQGRLSADWVYSKPTAPWWQTFKTVNLIGKLPPPPVDPTKSPTGSIPPPPVLDIRPLEDVIELVSLVYDGKEGGRGGNTHVVLRYKPEANVELPEWVVRENSPPVAAAGAPVARDTVRGQGGGQVGRGVGAPQPAPTVPAAAIPNRAGRPNPPTTATPMPTSMTGREILQKVWVDDQGDMRRSSTLWPVRGNDGKVFGTVKLVRVAPDAQTAYFVRVLPPAAPGQTAPEPKEERLLKTAMNLRQDVLEELHRLQGRSASEPSPTAAAKPAASSAWQDVPETTRTGNQWQLSRKDEQRIRENPDQLFEQFSVETYVGRSGAVRGVTFRSVEPQLAQRFGVAPGEVLIEVNGRTVESKAQALQFGKADYGRGVRTFVTKWLSNGQVVERVYQAPDR
jgi:hypothetical protein